ADRAVLRGCGRVGHGKRRMAGTRAVAADEVALHERGISVRLRAVRAGCGSKGTLRATTIGRRRTLCPAPRSQLDPRCAPDGRLGAVRVVASSKPRNGGD